MTKSKGKYATVNNKSDKCVPALEYKKKGDCAEAPSRKRGDCSMGLKKTDVLVTESPSKKKNVPAAATNQKKRNDLALAVIRKKRDDCFKTESPKKRDDRRLAVVHHKKRDDTLTDESSEEASGRRKHHRLWTISEVRKLIEGVSQYGVGRWSRIKKLFFAASAHRTSVDLKVKFLSLPSPYMSYDTIVACQFVQDKWRNLLKASGMQEQRSQQVMHISIYPSIHLQPLL